MSNSLVLPANIAARLQETCGVCEFKHKDSDGDTVCRRFPPQVSIILAPMPPPRTGLGPVAQSCYPPVKDGMRACGEFKRKSDA